MIGPRSKNFSSKELCCRCGCKEGPKLEMISALQRVRDALGRPMILTSAMRCKKHNEKVGGRPKSRHLDGLAVDVSTAKFSEAEWIALLEIASETGFLGIGLYDTFVHLDLRDVLTVWDGRTHKTKKF